MLTCYVESRKTAPADLGLADLQVSKKKIQLSYLSHSFSDMPLDLSVAMFFK